MKNHTLQTTTLLLFAASLFSSCGSIFYAPSQPHLPMVNKKGVTKIEITGGLGGYSTGTFLNGFHSVSDKVGLMGNYSSMWLDGNSLNSFDIGAGLFKATDTRSGFEIYSTIGYGKLKLTTYDWYTGNNYYYASTDMFRFAVQPDIFYAGKNFEVGFGIRFQYFSYGNTSRFDEYEVVANNHFMLEPTLKLGVGGEKVKFNVQGTVSEKLSGGNLSYDKLMISIGLSLRISPKENRR